MPQEVDAITKLYDYLLWMIPKLENHAARSSYWPTASKASRWIFSTS